MINFGILALFLLTKAVEYITGVWLNVLLDKSWVWE